MSERSIRKGGVERRERAPRSTLILTCNYCGKNFKDLPFFEAHRKIIGHTQEVHEEERMPSYKKKII
jgi:hypothetical protein